ncbi:hypothetical protein K458DRAFT_417516 [Lentithecium fluviatile CBS 122367]|uniref:Uncharacterized protein n=1 Tax=Lentithecium fluviatile CBS 122367 TaxID=1168545 RepID=A0A6G1J5F0_9PLEO|nr:hypothetical protein K458DRAFT_417516 [Lentithecium fluviatile CBS 122367]
MNSISTIPPDTSSFASPGHQRCALAARSINIAASARPKADIGGKTRPEGVDWAEGRGGSLGFLVVREGCREIEFVVDRLKGGMTSSVERGQQGRVLRRSFCTTHVATGNSYGLCFV